MINKKHILDLEQGENFALDIKHAKNYVAQKMDKDSGEFRDGLPDTIVIHYTAGTTMAGALSVLNSPKYEASAHFLVDNDQNVATTYQLMPLNKIAWHAGVSEMGNRKSINKYSIGIEIVNPGYLTRTGDGKFLTAFNRTVLEDDAVEARHKNESHTRYWHRYMEEQVSNVLYLCNELKELFPIQYIVGHDEISPGRKQDPGPLFPIEKIRQYVLQQGKIETEIAGTETPNIGHVTASLLNIRESGDSQATKVAMPLKKGQQVKILEDRGGWYKVKTEIEGWVSKNHIES